MDLSPAVFAGIDLAEKAGGLAGGCTIYGDVVPVQAVECVMALADPASPGAWRVESAGGVDPAAALAFPGAVSRERCGGPAVRCGGAGRGLGRPTDIHRRIGRSVDPDERQHVVALTTAPSG